MGDYRISCKCSSQKMSYYEDVENVPQKLKNVRKNVPKKPKDTMDAIMPKKYDCAIIVQFRETIQKYGSPQHCAVNN